MTTYRRGGSCGAEDWLWALGPLAPPKIPVQKNKKKKHLISSSGRCTATMGKLKLETTCNGRRLSKMTPKERERSFHKRARIGLATKQIFLASIEFRQSLPYCRIAFHWNGPPGRNKTHWLVWPSCRQRPPKKTQLLKNEKNRSQKHQIAFNSWTKRPGFSRNNSLHTTLTLLYPLFTRNLSITRWPMPPKRFTFIFYFFGTIFTWIREPQPGASRSVALSPSPRL